MTTTPKATILEQEQIRLLYQQHVEPRLDLLMRIPIPAHDAGTPKRHNHEAFCCKKQTYRYCEPDSEEEVAVVSFVTRASGNSLPPYIVVSRLILEGQVYEARLFGH